METVDLAVYGIKITWDGGDRGGASITSDLKDADIPENSAFNAAIDGIESMVLGHFCAGVDVESYCYLEGIEAAVQATANNL